LFNPAFAAITLRAAAVGHSSAAAEGLPFSLAFLVLPLVFHAGTRSELPRSVSTSMPAWLTQHALVREEFASRVTALAPVVREAVAFGLASRVLSVQSGARLVADRTLPKRLREAVDDGDVDDIVKRAHFVGRWLGNAGSATTVYALWGIRP
jgi:hypothetical protein